MSESTKILVGLVALFLLCGATYFLVRNNELKAAPQSPAATTYTNTEYGYSFSHDPALTLIEFTPEYVTLEDQGAAEPNEVVQVAVENADISESFESAEEYARTRALVFCAADGPTASMRCTRTTRTEPFTTATGITGEVFYLEFVETRGEEVATREAGPFFAFNVSMDTPGSGYSALIFRPARFHEESAAYDRGAQATLDVVNTLKIFAR